MLPDQFISLLHNSTVMAIVIDDLVPITVNMQSYLLTYLVLSAFVEALGDETTPPTLITDDFVYTTPRDPLFLKIFLKGALPGLLWPSSLSLPTF